MTPKTLLIVDVETNGLEPATSKAIEVGAVLWSVEHRTLLASYSQLLPAGANPCEPINRIPAAALPLFFPRMHALVDLALRADAITAWNAAFDRQFGAPLLDLTDADQPPWFCAMDDLDWKAIGYPEDGGRGLVAVALWHHCGVASAHRAVDDCLLLARLLEAVAREVDALNNGLHDAFDAWLAKGLARGTAPRARFVSLAPFEEKETVKRHGFRWSEPGFERQWSKVMPISEAKELPFRVRQVLP